MSVRGRSTLAAGVVLAALAVGACTGGDGGGDAGRASTPAPTDRADGAGVPTADTEPVEITEPDTTTTAAPDSVPATEAATTTIGTVPEDGVPGIDSGDAFCRSWSEFAGSFQALAAATSFGADPDNAAVLEVAASPALVAAVQALDANLPAELESERSVFVVDLAGPMSRRAERARSELIAAGLSDEALAELGLAWLAALSAAGLGEPDIDFAVPDGVDASAFDAAVDTFRDALPPINQDPSLITDAEFPLTDQYLTVNCPDQGTLGGNDVIDEI